MKKKLIPGIIISLLCILHLSFSVFAATPSQISSNALRNQIAWQWSYYTRGYYENNCLAYALGSNTQWIWPWGSRANLNDATRYLTSVGYNCSYIPGATPRITIYAKNGEVQHFARVIGPSSTRAKWGHYEVFSHNTYDPYTNVLYGSWVASAY